MAKPRVFQPQPDQPMLVGFTGFKRSGKGICAEGLTSLGFTDVPFAGGLKAMLSAWLEYNGVTDTKIYTDDWYKDHKSRYFCDKQFRHAMQTLGTEWGRAHIGEHFWINGWARKIAQYDRVAVSDVRFPDEVSAIHSRGGIIIRVNRPSFRNEDEHESETNFKSLKYDFEVVNETIKRTQNQVKKIVTEHFKLND